MLRAFKSFAHEKSKTKRACHSKSAVIRRAATETDDDFFRAAVSRVQNYFANAGCGCDLGIQFVRLQTAHPGRFAHLHYREFAIVDPAVTRFDFTTKRIVGFAFEPGATERLRNYFGGPLTAVSHRYNVDLRLRQNIAQSRGNCFSNLDCAQGALEFIWRN